MPRSSANCGALAWRGVYGVLLCIARPLVRLRLWWRGRREPGYRERIAERFGRMPPGLPHRPLWIHAVSAGETIAAVPLIERLLLTHPDVPVLVTTMTPAGSGEVRRRLGARVAHCYAPYDFPAAVRRFFAHTQPRALILVETELWPNFLRYAARDRIPVVLVNGRLSARSARGYGRIGALTREMLAGFSLIGCQSDAHRERFIALGASPECVQALGSVKFDVWLPAELGTAAAGLRASLGWHEQPVVIAASTHPGEDEQVLAAFGRMRREIPAARLLLVPRHPVRAETVLALATGGGLTGVLQSQLTAATPVPDVLVGDVMGSLLLLYGVADVAFVGGSLVATGGHNPIEPALWGLPVVVGPHTFNFTDIVEDFRQAQALVEVPDAAGLAAVAVGWLTDRPSAQASGRRALELVERRRGALERTLTALGPVLSLRAE